MKNLQEKEIRYVIYARRSVEKTGKEDKVASIESQIKEVKEMAEKESLRVIGTFQEAKSAKEPYRREQFQKMIDTIQKGKADGILCWKIDRLARNAVDEGTVKYLLQKGIIKHIKATDRDWRSDDNALLAAVEFGVATQYSRDLSKHIKRGLRARLESGVRPSIAPVGYKNSKYHEKGKEEILVDEERFPIVRKLFDLALTTAYSPLKLTKIANEQLGLTTRTGKKSGISKSNIYRILTDPFYYGVFEYPVGSGNWYKGIHKPIITKAEYDKIQYFLSRGHAPRPKTHFFAYTGLMKCGECGAAITAQEKIKIQQNGNVHRYVYYGCTKRIDANCKQKNIREEVLEKEINEFLQRLEMPKVFHDWAIETLKEIHEQEKNSRDSLILRKQHEYNSITFQLDKLLELRMADEISPEDYKRKKSELEKQEVELSSFLGDLNARINNWIVEIEKCMDFAAKARTEFEKGDAERRKEILTVLGWNHILKDGKLNILPTKQLSTLEKAVMFAKTVSGRLEPPNSEAEQGRIKQKYQENEEMWRWAESNRRAINVYRTNLRC